MIKFSKPFWVANFVELLERLAFYAVFIVITLYLSMSGVSPTCRPVSFPVSIQPSLSASYLYRCHCRQDGIPQLHHPGFRPANYRVRRTGPDPTILQSAGLVNYSMTTTYIWIDRQHLPMVDNPDSCLYSDWRSLHKSGDIWNRSPRNHTETRARGYAIFYMMVNIGAFLGKTVVDPLRKSMGDEGLVYLNFFSATMTFLALIAVFFFYRSAHRRAGEKDAGAVAFVGKSAHKQETDDPVADHQRLLMIRANVLHHA